MDTMPIRPNRFLRSWVVHALAVWPMGVITCIILWIPLTIGFSVINRLADSVILAHIMVHMMLVVIPGLAIGSSLGQLQAGLLEQELNWHMPDWVRVTMVGGVIGATLVMILGMLLRESLTMNTRLLWTMPLFMLGVSSTQWLLLRRTTRESWLWVLGNFVGGIVFSGLIAFNHPDTSSDFYSLWFLGLWSLAAGAQGFITGIVMLWLYDRPQSQRDDEPELAYVPIEVRTRDHE